MPANVILFSDYSSLPAKPSRLYCDSNFLIRLLFYHNNVSFPARLTPAEIAAYQFYTQVKQDCVDLITSVYGFSELVHFYFFNYGSSGMYKVVKRFLAQRNITLQGTIHDKYKYFIKNFPSDFRAAFSLISNRVVDAEEFLNALGVKILYPLPSPQLTNISRNVTEYATILLDAFPKLESHDAMHLSIADYLNTPYIVSLDEAYKDIEGFTVFTLN